MTTGFDTGAYPGAHFDNWDAASRRRYAVSQKAPKSPWDTPDGWTPQPTQRPAAAPAATATSAAPATSSPGGGGTTWSASSSGDPLLDLIVHNAMQNYGGAVQGARLGAADSMGNDPQAAGFASLQALLGGQGQMARSLGDLGSQYGTMKEQQDFQERMMRLQYQLAEEEARRSSANQWLHDLLQAGGTLGGAWLGG